MSVNVVQRLMGHEHASTTPNRYVHSPRDFDDRVRAALGDAWHLQDAGSGYARGGAGNPDTASDLWWT